MNERCLVKMVPANIPEFVANVGPFAAGVALIIAADAIENVSEMTDDSYVCRLTLREIADRAGITLADCHDAIGRLMKDGSVVMHGDRYMLMRWQP